MRAPGRPPAPGEALVRVASAGVNPSDVKAVLGAMPHAVWPRTPGRDYAGTVIEGPAALVGKEVWGSGGELGIRRDGTHAEWLVVPVEHVREKPAAVGLIEAGAVGVPFITAYAGLEDAGGVQARRRGPGVRRQRQGRPGDDPARHHGRGQGVRGRADPEGPIAATPAARSR